MPSPKRRKLALITAACLSIAAVGVVLDTPVLAQDAAEATTRTYSGITAPSKQFQLALSNLGKVAEVSVEKGDEVTADQLLLRQDDEIEKARLEELVAEADVTGRVETARQQADLARVRETRQEKLLSNGGGNQLEFEEAKIGRIVAEANIDEEQRQGTASAARVKQLQITLRQKVLKAPAAGVVRSIEARVGEMHGPQEPVVELIVVNPLKVEVLGMPPSLVGQMKRGDTVQVRYSGGDGWLDAKVTFIDPVVNVSVDEQTVELELPNPNGLPAGLEVEVRPSTGRQRASAE